MAFERNDIATKNRLMSGLGEELMGYEHNDIVTVDVMNKAIEEGGGGGGGDFNVANVTVTPKNSLNPFELDLSTNDDGAYSGIFVSDVGFFHSAYVTQEAKTFKLFYLGDSCEVVPYNVLESVTGDAVYDSGTGLITITGDCTITGYMDD